MRRITRRVGEALVQPHEPTTFMPHLPDNPAVMHQLFGVTVERDEEAEVPGGVLTPYGVFGPVERING